MNNAVYGKTMEDMRKRIKVRIVKMKKILLSVTSKPTYINHKIYEENLTAIHGGKKYLAFNRLNGKWITFSTTLWLDHFTINYCSLTQTVCVMKYMKKIYTKNFINTNTYFI